MLWPATGNHHEEMGGILQKTRRDEVGMEEYQCLGARRSTRPRRKEAEP